MNSNVESYQINNTGRYKWYKWALHKLLQQSDARWDVQICDFCGFCSVSFHHFVSFLNILAPNCRLSLNTIWLVVQSLTWGTLVLCTVDASLSLTVYVAYSTEWYESWWTDAISNGWSRKSSWRPSLCESYVHIPRCTSFTPQKWHCWVHLQYYLPRSFPTVHCHNRLQCAKQRGNAWLILLRQCLRVGAGKKDSQSKEQAWRLFVFLYLDEFIWYERHGTTSCQAFANPTCVET